MTSKMIRWMLVAALLAAVCLQAGAQEDTRVLQKVSEHVHALMCEPDSLSPSSFGSNSTLIVGMDAAMVVDTQISVKDARRLLAEIRKVTDKPLRFVVNTHHHHDHVQGNAAFLETGAVFIAHDFTRAELQKIQSDGKGEAKESPVVVPNVSFPDRMTVDLGGVEVLLNFPGPSHTKGSITVEVPRDKVLVVEDMLFNRCHPFMGDGDLENWPKVLETLAKNATPDTKIIPGHGPLANRRDLLEMRDYLLAFDKEAKALCVGKTAADAPKITDELVKRLPRQGRENLGRLVERNLVMKYLPVAKNGR